MNIRQEKEIVIVSISDQQPTLNQWVALMDELNRRDCPAVIDARFVIPSMSEIDAYLLAIRASEMPQLRCHRMAIVMAGELHPDLDFFVSSASISGLETKPFDCIDTATAWAASRHSEIVESNQASASDSRQAARLG